MSLITRMEDEVKQAMLARDTERRDALRLILSSLRAAEKELQRPLSDGEELQVLQRERKRRQEAAEAFRSGGRPEQAASEERELDVLQEFMPEPLNEDERAFRNTLDVVAAAGATKVHVFPYSPRPGTRTAAHDPVPTAVKRERSARLRQASHDACLQRWRGKIGRDDVVLVDRPGRGYGDDYSPWLVDAPVGELVRVRGATVSERGILAA